MTEIIKTDGTRLETKPANGTDFTLDEMQSMVGGLIEIIELDEELSMVMNEEGKLLGLPYNKVADDIFHRYFSTTSDFIVGDVLVCNNELIR